jgi:stage V sporulation protein R
MEENTVTDAGARDRARVVRPQLVLQGQPALSQWTDASAILDYLVFARATSWNARSATARPAVEEVIDACHALMAHGVDRYRPAAAPTLKIEAARLSAREQHREKSFNDLWRTLPRPRQGRRLPPRLSAEPQENILYFVEKHSPRLEPWQRELVRIVRKLAQYFYPQSQTKVMNEGWATFWHYTILNRCTRRDSSTTGSCSSS